MSKNSSNLSITDPPGNKEPYIADSCLTDPISDRLGRLPFAERIASTLAKRRDVSSLVVSIHGKWGEGKSTVLEFVYGALQQYEHVVAVRFNPWRCPDETALLLSFFATIASAFDKSDKTKKEKIGKLFKEYGSVVGEFSIEVQGAKISAGNSIAKLGEVLSAVSVEETKKRIEDLLSRSRKRVVVFLDDIDRLDRSEAQAVFKMLKLTGNIDHVSYVLAFDRDVVAASISERYGDGNTQAGYEYLEKVVQVNLDLPAADRDVLARICLEHVADALLLAGTKLSEEQQREFQSVFLEHVAPAIGTLRMAKLYANSVAFVLPLLAGEINAVDLLLLEAIKFIYPQIHRDIRVNPHAYTGDFGWDCAAHGRAESWKSHLEKVVRDAAGDIGGDGHERARDLLTHLFPQVSQLFVLGKYGEHRTDDWQQNQRVASLDYLWRYLTCSVPHGDVSDQRVDRFIGDLPQLAEDLVADSYLSLLGRGDQRVLLIKLLRRAETMQQESARKVALAVAHHGADLGFDSGIVSGPRAIACNLLRALISRVDQSARFAVATDVLQQAEPIDFAVECLRYLRPSANEGATAELFDSELVHRMEVIVAERIASLVKTSSLLDYPRHVVGALLWAWSRGKGTQEVKDFLGSVLIADPKASQRIISIFGYDPYQMSPVGFDDARYETVGQFVDPQMLFNALNAAGLFESVEVGEDARAVREFAEVHEKKKGIG